MLDVGCDTCQWGRPLDVMSEPGRMLSKSGAGLRANGMECGVIGLLLKMER